jgi:hypothetical protein
MRNLSIRNKKINTVIGAWEATLLYVLCTLLKYENVYGSTFLARKQKEKLTISRLSFITKVSILRNTKLIFCFALDKDKDFMSVSNNPIF